MEGVEDSLEGVGAADEAVDFLDGGVMEELREGVSSDCAGGACEDLVISFVSDFSLVLYGIARATVPQNALANSIPCHR